MGFRAGSGTLQVAQILSDLIALRRRQGRHLWLASFDIEKCFDSLPWWGLFRVLQHAGVDIKVVKAFSAYYKDLRRRFRYGQVDGEVWHAANGMAQGCQQALTSSIFSLKPFIGGPLPPSWGFQWLATTWNPSVLQTI